MKRDNVLVAAVLLLTLFAVGVVWIVPSHAEDRIYPFAGAMYRFETGVNPRLYFESGAALSLGPVAPSFTLQVPVTGKIAVGGELRVRMKF